MDLAEAQQLFEDVRNLEADVARLDAAVTACEDQILEARSDKLVRSAKRGKAEHKRELRATKNRLTEAKRAVKAIPADVRAQAEPAPVPQEHVEAHAGVAGARGGSN